MKANNDLTNRIKELVQELPSLKKEGIYYCNTWLIGHSELFIDWCERFSNELRKLPQHDLVVDIRNFLSNVRWGFPEDLKHFNTLNSKAKVLIDDLDEIISTENNGNSPNTVNENNTTTNIGGNTISGDHNTTFIITENPKPQKPKGFWERVLQDVSVKVIVAVLTAIAAAVIGLFNLNLNNDNIETPVSSDTASEQESENGSNGEDILENSQDNEQANGENETPVEIENEIKDEATVDSGSVKIMLKLEKETAYLEERINIFVNASETIESATISSKSETEPFGPFSMHPTNDNTSFGFVSQFTEPGTHTVTVEVVVASGETISISDTIEVLNIIVPNEQEDIPGIIIVG